MKKRKSRNRKKTLHLRRKQRKFFHKKLEIKNMVSKEEHKQNAYNEFLKKFDSPDYKTKDPYIINNEFQDVIKKLIQDNMHCIASKADLDRQVFSVRKSFDYQDDENNGTAKGLSWQIFGTERTDAETEVPFYWPDVRALTKNDFEFFEQRYNVTNNLYAKTEYGLMIYFGQKTNSSKNNRFKTQLCNELLSLAQEYYDEAQKGDGPKLGYTLNTLTLTFHIAEKNKIQEQIRTAIDQIIDIQQNWDIDTSNTNWVPLRFSALMLENYTVFKEYVDFSKVINRNDHAIELLAKSNLYDAVDALIFNDKIKQKVGLSIDDSLRQRAEIYEKIADSRKNDIASIHFIELALDIYQKLKDETKIKEVMELYSERRNTIPLTEVSTEIPDVYIKTIDNLIKEKIETCTEKELLDEFTMSPWYETNESIKALSKKVPGGFMDTLPVSILDKHGNTVKKYSSEEAKFWNTYGFYFGFSTLQMTKLFSAAIESGKLSYESVLDYLNKTWLNDFIEIARNGEKLTVVPLDTIKPGLKKIFEEFKHTEENYIHDYVTIIDSLTLKIEGLLRFFIKKLQIPTCAQRRSKDGFVIMEKLFDDIIADLKGTPEKPTGFDKNLLTMLKYVMTEKIGWNLRNEVAHSLLQIEDYSLDKVVVLLCLILKLSQYAFRQTDSKQLTSD